VNPEPGILLLERLARRWRRTLGLACALQALGLALLLGSLAGPAGGWSLGTALGAGTAAWLVLYGALLAVHWKRARDPSLLARHLDRMVPALQESCELALQRPGSFLEGLQRKRVLAVLAELPEQDLLPRGLMRRSLWIGGGTGLCALILIGLWNGRTPEREAQDAPEAVNTADSRTAQDGPRPIRLESIRAQVEPPGYTGWPRREVQGLDLQTPEGSSVRWTAVLSRPVERLTLVSGDGGRLALSVDGAAVFRAEQTLWTSRIVFLEAEEQGRVTFRSDYGKLEVVRDEPPALRILQPPRRTEFEPDQAAPIRLEALARDDYGVARAELVLTLTSGSGESVRFREQRVALGPLGSDSPASPTSFTPAPPANVELRATLDPAALGMAPGDELYFHVEALDNREPAPNRARSETCFIRIRQAEQAPVASAEGIAINPVPEYFRSQRQIILDTEKLIAQRPELDPAEFRRRSEALGIDQRLLRMRYGLLLGEEFEDGSVPGPEALDSRGRDPEAHGAEEPEGHGAEEPEGHAHGAPEPPGLDPGPGASTGALAGLPEGLVHQHDSAETATYFPNEVRATLKAALAQMWQAELHLRTIRPEAALPHEYEALRHLKSLQEATRVYVERVGFEPPPLEPDEKRLTGDLKDISDQGWQRQFVRERSEPHVREALRRIGTLRGGAAGLGQDAAATLQRAGQALAAQELRKPGGSLEALRDLRTLVGELQDGRFACRTCVESVERALWGLLPPAQAAPGRSAQPASSVFGAYLDALEREP
jgi:hypothetical protein